MNSQKHQALDKHTLNLCILMQFIVNKENAINLQSCSVLFMLWHMCNHFFFINF